MPKLEIRKGFFKVRFASGEPVTEAAPGKIIELTDEELKHWYTRAAIDEGRARVKDGTESPEDRMSAVFPKLAAADFKADGTPRVKAVETLLGEDVSADQVAEAWAGYKEGGE